jgi:hypothetical protein
MRLTSNKRPVASCTIPQQRRRPRFDHLCTSNKENGATQAGMSSWLVYDRRRNVFCLDAFSSTCTRYGRRCGRRQLVSAAKTLDTRLGPSVGVDFKPKFTAFCFLSTASMGQVRSAALCTEYSPRSPAFHSICFLFASLDSMWQAALKADFSKCLAAKCWNCTALLKIPAQIAGLRLGILC